MLIYVVNTHTVDACDRLRRLIVPTYGDIDPHMIGGRWFVYEIEGQYVACLWTAAERPFAYLDYLACDSGRGHGLRLAAAIGQAYRLDGYTRILANVHGDNELMVRAIARLQGHAPKNGPYYLVDLARR